GRRHPEPEAVIAAYRRAKRATAPAEVLSAVITDYMFTVPTRRLVAAHAEAGRGETFRGGDTWTYEFAWPSPQFDGKLGACHALELPFVFDYRGDGLTGPHGALGPAGTLRDPALGDLFTRVHAAWVRFATTGDPGWPPCTPGHHVSQRLHTVREDAAEAPGGPELAVWDGHR
ncbi:carboxylesterase family protein, partial [Streptomyces sp. NPDC057654]|uniref:carboxylesterase family protein n=1 Tax=Streptomyces sp. NPDC057654 TaxID=3346196 RepID=UPI0036CE1D37